MDVAALMERMRSRRDYAGQLGARGSAARTGGAVCTPERPLPEPVRRLLAVARHRAAVLSPGGGAGVGTGGTRLGGRHRHGQRQNAVLQLADLGSGDIATADGALYLFPTKALAQDQLKGLLELVGDDAELAHCVRPGVYDGDTPTAQRRRIRGEANLVLSNPDMLHAAVLPYHPKWAAFFSELRYVVVDEVHTYRGIIGAHVSAVLRRLMRVCEHYGSRPVFLAASATIANPGELTSRLIGREVAVIDDDGSPRGRKYFALVEPVAVGQRFARSPQRER